MQMVPSTSSKDIFYPNAALPWFSLLPPGLIKSAYGEKTLEAFMNLYVPPGEMRTIHGKLSSGYEVSVLTLTGQARVSLLHLTDDVNPTQDRHCQLNASKSEYLLYPLLLFEHVTDFDPAR
jgi:hypothetical protein